MQSQQPYNSILHRVAQLTAACTLVLIFMGGLVTSHQAGMSVPDWPNSYGYNMFTFPPSQWVGGIFYEHTHRLMGSVVGFLAVLLVLCAYGWSARPSVRKGCWIAAGSTLGLAILFAASRLFVSGDSAAATSMKHGLASAGVGLVGVALVFVAAALMRHRESRLWVRRFALLILGLVIFQGFLGGLRVVLVKLDLAIIHACVAQAFFAIAATMAIVTSKWWLTQRDLEPHAAGRSLVTLAGICVVAIYLQLMVGATMRHYQAGLAIPDLPLHYGKLIPPTDQASLDAANAMRIDDQLPPTTLGAIWLHFGHRLGALLVTILLTITISTVLRKHKEPALRNPAFLLIGLLFSQLTLGILTVLWKKPADVASLHVATGALTLVTTVVLLTRAMRLYSPRWRSVPQGFETDYSPNHSIATA